MGTEQRMVVAKGPGLKLGFLVPTVNFFVPCFSNFHEGYEKRRKLRETDLARFYILIEALRIETISLSDQGYGTRTVIK